MLTQTKIFLNSCPGENSQLSEIIVLKTEAFERIQSKNDYLWTQSIDLIENILSCTQDLTSYLKKCRNMVPSTLYKEIELKFIPIPEDLGVIKRKVFSIIEDMKKLRHNFGKIELCKSLDWLISELESIDLETSESIETKFSSKTFAKLTKTLIFDINSSIENITKKYQTQTENESNEIEQEHLKNRILESLEDDLSLLNTKKILTTCTQIAQILFNLPPQKLNKLSSTISPILPKCLQFISLNEYFLTQQVASYRATCKLSSILLNIFIDLVSKGFCVPPEFADDIDQGMGKSSDGLGLGEGQGERDVSDRIESEDQLDDAQPAGQEKEQEPDKDCKEEEKGIEMSEDFDSKLQDVEKTGDDSDEESNSDVDEQMGETEKDSDKQCKENYGSDKEDGQNSDLEMDEEQNGECNGEEIDEKEIGAKENESKDQNNSKNKEKSNEINDMNEQEFDDEQTDPYHGNQPELPEPEPMDLPDDLQLDGGQEDETGGIEENPFDIDTMKDQESGSIEEIQSEVDVNEPNDQEIDFSSEDEDILKKQDEFKNDTDKNDEESTDEKQVDEREETIENTDDDNKQDIEENNESAMDQTHSNEDNIESMETDKTNSDKVIGQEGQDQNPETTNPIEEIAESKEQDGVGQSNMDNSTGHSAQTKLSEEIPNNSKRQRDETVQEKRKPGETDSQRSLGDVSGPVMKKLKTVDNKNDENNAQEGNEEDKIESEMYEHIKDAKETPMQVLDAATKEQATSQKISETQKENEETEETLDDLQPEEIDIDVRNTEEKLERNKMKNSDNKKLQSKVTDATEVKIDGDLVETLGVSGGAPDSTYHTLYEDLSNTGAHRLTPDQVFQLRQEVETQLSSWHDVTNDNQSHSTWRQISSMTSRLSEELAERLRLILEPTEASRLQGDYRTGRRINMRKVIPYIASQYRKDRIWLRRSRPWKRTYQIVLAMDDSSSMSDNHSKQLAFESVALIAKALTLLESGELAVVSFGERTRLLHKLTDRFTEQSGANLLRNLKFDQSKTSVGQLVDFVAEMLLGSGGDKMSGVFNAKLLVIVSDGRGVFSEGESFVRGAVRRARLANVFMVFVIIDSPENKNTIFDIRMPVFLDGKLTGIDNYMDVFPFSFYIVLKDINCLPNVLSDALRQWFELVSNLKV